MAKSFTQTGIETDLHAQITKEAARNKQSFSAQIREYRDKSIALDEKVDELSINIVETQENLVKAIRTARETTEENNKLKEEIRKLTDVN